MGNIVPSAQITVVDEATGLLATIYSGRAGGALANPFYATSQGFAQFFAANGIYRITAKNTTTLEEVTWRYVDLNSIATTDNAGAVIRATTAQAQAGTAGVVPDAQQVRQNHVGQVATIAALRALEPAFDGQQVELLGHTIAGIGGGVFYHDAASSAADDNGVTIVTTGGKRWIRVISGFVSPDWFGYVDQSGNSCNAAVTAADAVAVAKNLPVLFTQNTYRFTATYTRQTQSGWFGYCPKSSFGTNHEVIFYGRVADIGSGNPMIRCSADGVAAQSIVFANISFESDKSVNSGSLSTTDSTGVNLVDVSHVKNGLEFISCSFARAAGGLVQGNASPYMGKTTLKNCHFNLLYRAISGDPTTGFSLTDCLLYDCYDFIDCTTSVTLIGCAINNSSFADARSSVSAKSITMVGGWTEGGNRIFRPINYLSVDNVIHSETLASSGSDKFLIEPQVNNCTIIFKGSRVPTNTRLIDLSGVTVTTIFMNVEGAYDGINFSDVSDINTKLDAGLNYRGWGNTNSGKWNVREGEYRKIINANATLDASANSKVLYHTSASAHTYTIPANASDPLPIGTRFLIVNENGGGNVTLTSTDTIRYAASTGNKVFTANQYGAVVKVADTVWRVYDYT